MIHGLLKMLLENNVLIHTILNFCLKKEFEVLFICWFNRTSEESSMCNIFL